MAALPVVAMGIGIGITLSLYRSIITGLAPQQFRGGLVSISESGGRLIATLTPLSIGIALTQIEPVLGPESALRWIVVAAGVLAAAIGVTSVLVAYMSPPVSGIDEL
jgi:hypothetical protein